MFEKVWDFLARVWSRLSSAARKRAALRKEKRLGGKETGAKQGLEEGKKTTEMKAALAQEGLEDQGLEERENESENEQELEQKQLDS